MRIIQLSSMVFILFLILGCVKEEKISDTTKKQSIESNIISEPEEEKILYQERLQIIEEPKERPIQKETEVTEKPQEKQKEKRLIIFHNNKGQMCIEQLDFLDEIKSKYPSLIIEEHLTYEAGATNLLYDLMPQYGKSEGVSTNFEYLPITFINNHAYSGFNEEVERQLEEDIKEVCK